VDRISRFSKQEIGGIIEWEFLGFKRSDAEKYWEPSCSQAVDLLARKPGPPLNDSEIANLKTAY